MDNNTNINNVEGMYSANCRISTPILYPQANVKSFNGFAWSNSMGMIHETSPIVDEGWQQWLGTQQ